MRRNIFQVLTLYLCNYFPLSLTIIELGPLFPKILRAIQKILDLQNDPPLKVHCKKLWGSFILRLNWPCWSAGSNYNFSLINLNMSLHGCAGHAFFFFKLFPVLKVVSLRFHTNFVNIHKRTFEITYSSLNFSGHL